jgi:hypothetical protein
VALLLSCWGSRVRTAEIDRSNRIMLMAIWVTPRVCLTRSRLPRP